MAPRSKANERPRDLPRNPEFRERIRAKLLAAAEAVIAAEGLAAVQARRVATEAGCAVGTVYNIFGDIDGLILAANTRTLSDLAIALKAAQCRESERNLETRLMALAVAYLNFATLNQFRWRAVFEHRLPDDYPIPQAYLDDRRGLLGLIETEIETSGPTDPEERQDAARALFSATHGNVLLALDAKLGPFEPDRCERQIRFLVRHVVKGLGHG